MIEEILTIFMLLSILYLTIDHFKWRYNVDKLIRILCDDIIDIYSIIDNESEVNNYE